MYNHTENKNCLSLKEPRMVLFHVSTVVQSPVYNLLLLLLSYMSGQRVNPMMIPQNNQVKDPSHINVSGIIKIYSYINLVKWLRANHKATSRQTLLQQLHHITTSLLLAQGQMAKAGQRCGVQTISGTHLSIKSATVQIMHNFKSSYNL